jgi:hypothetical protein
MESTNIIFWVLNGLAIGIFTIMAYLLKNVFEGVKKELAELKVVMNAILEFAAIQKEKNINCGQAIDNIWSKINTIETKQEQHVELINKIKNIHNLVHPDKKV